ncbi:hypothetical protein ACFY2W_22415 [Streptomyces sp. NPDC001262]|uniref:hypothetical protein n=1 Tax=Streptomyces sp. NPDC001262 TaxID=3364552 RepID=UPI003690AC50
MRPKLRGTVRYVRCPQGIYLHGDTGSCTLTGRSLYDWMTRLEPFLTGRHTLDELTAALPPAHRAMVRNLVGLLQQHGFVTDASPERGHGLTGAECEEYAEEIAFVRHAADSAEHRFERFRRARLLLAGGGPVAWAVVEAALAAGCRDLRVAVPHDEVTSAREAAVRGRRDAAQHADIVTGDAAALLDGIDAVLHVCATGRHQDAGELARICDRAGLPLGQVLVTGGEAWLSPFGLPSGTQVDGGWRRLGAARTTGTEPADPWLTGPVPALVASHSVLGAFRHFTGLDTPATDRDPGPRFTLIDLCTLQTTDHPCLPHPAASPTPSGTRTDTSGPVDAQDLLNRISTLVDSRTGVFTSFSEEDFPQLPLWACRIQVTDPHGILPRAVTPPAPVGCGDSRESSRTQALLKGLTAYSWLAGAVTQGPAPLPGTDLLTGAAAPVPAQQVYARGAPDEPGTAVPPGMASALDWDAAVAAATGALCEALLADALARGEPVGCIPVPPDDEALTAQSRRWWRLLNTCTGPLYARHVYTVHWAGLPGLPSCAVTTGDGHLVLASGDTRAQAVSGALRDALLDWQAHTAGRPEWGPPRIAVPTGLLDSAPAAHPYPDRTPVEALAAAGHRPVAVRLDADPLTARLLPHVARVVLQ